MMNPIWPPLSSSQVTFLLPYHLSCAERLTRSPFLLPHHGRHLATAEWHPFPLFVPRFSSSCLISLTTRSLHSSHNILSRSHQIAASLSTARLGCAPHQDYFCRYCKCDMPYYPDVSSANWFDNHQQGAMGIATACDSKRFSSEMFRARTACDSDSRFCSRAIATATTCDLELSSSETFGTTSCNSEAKEDEDGGGGSGIGKIWERSK